MSSSNHKKGQAADDLAKALYEEVSRSHHLFRSDRITNLILVVALLAGVGRLTLNLASAWKPATFSLLGGPAGGSYDSIRHEMLEEFDGLNDELHGGDRSAKEKETNRYPTAPWYAFSPERHLDAQPARMSSKGSDDNIANIVVDEGRYRIGLCQDSPFDSEKDNHRLRALAPAYTSSLYIFVRKDEYFNDNAKDKVTPEFRKLVALAKEVGGSRPIAFGSPSAKAAFGAIAWQYGWKPGLPASIVQNYADLFQAGKIGQSPSIVEDTLPYSKGLELLQKPDPNYPNGLLAYAILVGSSAPILEDVAAGLTLVHVDRAQGQSLRQLGYKPNSIPAGSIPSSQEMPAYDVPTVGASEVLACNADLPEQDAYDIVQRISLIPILRDYLKNFGNAWASPESATFIPLHPGALRFFRKQDMPQPFDQWVFGFLITAAGSALAKFKRHLVRPHLDELDRMLGAYVGHPEPKPNGLAKHPTVVKFAAYAKLKLGLIDDSHYGCVEKYCDFVEDVVKKRTPRSRAQEANGASAAVLPELQIRRANGVAAVHRVTVEKEKVDGASPVAASLPE